MAIPRAQGGEEPLATQVERLSANIQTTMTYIEQFEAELVKKLTCTQNTVTLVTWICERVLESYKNGIAAGQKGVKNYRAFSFSRLKNSYSKPWRHSTTRSSDMASHGL